MEKLYVVRAMGERPTMLLFIKNNLCWIAIGNNYENIYLLADKQFQID